MSDHLVTFLWQSRTTTLCKYNQSYDWIDLVQETLPGYFKEDARCHGLKCTKCKIVVSERSGEGVFTSSVHKPIYMCGN